MNWLNDNKEKVKALELSDPNMPDSLGGGKYFSPHQAYIYQKYYPLTRDIYIYSRADNYGVAAGFTTFIASAPRTEDRAERRARPGDDAGSSC